MPSDDQSRVRRLSNLIVLFGALVILVLWLYFGFIVESLRERAWSDAAGRSGHLLRSVERILDRDIKLYDLGIQAVADGMQNLALEGVSPEVRQLGLFDRASQAPGYGAIFVLDAHGNAFIESGSLVPRPLNGADRAYFQVHKDRDMGLFVGAPWKTRVSGRDMIPLSRRFTYADGAFAGVVVGAIELSYFAKLFEHINTDPSLRIALSFEGAGGAPVRVSFRDGAAYGAASDPGARPMDQAEAGLFLTAPDGLAGERYNTFKRVGAYPVKVVVSIATAAVADAWMPQALAILLVVGALTAGALVLLVVLRRELVRRVQAEAELSRLALTDPLTGIPNRRHFDRALHEARGDHPRPVTVMLIDVDHFKRYNDRYGHPAGDQILKVVAARIAAVAAACAGTAFRVGGEEFAVLLTGASEDRGIAVAERVRTELRAAALAHADGIGGIVTISAGLMHSARYPLASDGQWLSLADDALYRAKRAGRDTVAVSGLPAPGIPPDGDALPLEAAGERFVA